MKKILTLVMTAVLALMLLSGCSDSDNSNKPWKELGVSEREYMEVYNYFRYGR